MKEFLIILAMCCVMLLSWPVAARAFDNPDSLDSLIREFAVKNTSRRRTGRLYSVGLPANLSGIEASIVSLKSGSLWRRGADFGLFRLPKRVLPWPFVRRVEIVYENLGNWSASFFHAPPNHTLASPVVGLIAYGADGRKIELSVMKSPILIHFPNISWENNDTTTRMKCVDFQRNGTAELSDVRRNGTCIVWGVGHFSVVVPEEQKEEEKKQKKKSRRSAAWKWWCAIGIGVGILGILFVIGIACKVVKGKRLGKMERQSEKSESLGAVWVGRSRMPCAASIRTQPVLENAYVP